MDDPSEPTLLVSLQGPGVRVIHNGSWNINCVDITTALLVVSGTFELTPNSSVIEEESLVSVESPDISGTVRFFDFFKNMVIVEELQQRPGLSAFTHKSAHQLLILVL